MSSRIPSHQLSNGLYVSGRPDPLSKPPSSTLPSRAVPYTGGDVTKSGELAKMFDIIPSSSSFRSGPSSGSGPLAKKGSVPGPGPVGKRVSLPGQNSGSGSGLQPTGLLTSGPLRRSGQLEPGPHSVSGPNSGSGLQPTGLLTSGPLGASVGRRSGQLEPGPGSNSVSGLQPTGLLTSGRRSGQLEPGSNSGSGSGLQPTGLLTSGPLGSSVGRRTEPAPVQKGKTVYGASVTTLGYDDVRLGFKVSKTLMWMLLVAAVIGVMIGVFLMVAVKKALVLVGVAGVLVVFGAVICWNFGYRKRGMLAYLRKYPDAELRGALDGQFVKVTGVVTCGSLPLESSFQKVPRCVYVSTELYEYKGWGGKSANPKHHCFSWGCRNSEKYMTDFYISDFQSGLRAVVKAGYGAKVAPFVKETTVVDITKENRESSPSFVSWLADRSLSCDDRVMRLKEGYIKEGSTVSVMGVVRRHDNVLMIVPPTEPISTGCHWGCGLFPTYVEGLVVTCDENQNADVIPV